MRAGGVPLAALLLVLASSVLQVLCVSDIYWEGEEEASNEFLEVNNEESSVLDHVKRLKRDSGWLSFNPLNLWQSSTEAEKEPVTESSIDDNASLSKDDDLDGGSGSPDKSESEFKEKTLRVTFLVMEPYIPAYSNRDSPEFQNISRSLANAVDLLFENLPGTQRSSLVRIQSLVNDDFLCKVTLDIVTTRNEDTDTIKEILRNHIQTMGRLGEYTVNYDDFSAQLIDPASSITPVEQGSSVDYDNSDKDDQTYATTPDYRNSESPPVDPNSTGSPDDQNPYASPDDQNSYSSPDDQNSNGSPDDQNPYASPDDQNSYSSPDDQNSNGSPDDQNPYASPDNQNSNGSPDDQNPYTSSDNQNYYSSPDDQNSNSSPDDQNSNGSPDDQNSNGSLENRNVEGSPDDQNSNGSSDDQNSNPTAKGDGNYDQSQTGASRQRGDQGDISENPTPNYDQSGFNYDQSSSSYPEGEGQNGVNYPYPTDAPVLPVTAQATTSNYDASAYDCPSTHMRCDESRCVENSQRCDGIYDCTDGTDEAGCPDSLKSVPSPKQNEIPKD